MASTSTISMKTKSGKIKSIYCHWDGYPEHHLPILEKNYDTIEKVEQLILLGDLSSLGASTECPKTHTFDTPQQGYCVAFGRDRKEIDTEAREFETIFGINKQQYNYLFDENKWKIL